MPKFARQTFAVEWAEGFTSVLAYRPEDIRAWMLDWYVIYDSSGRIVGRSA